MLRVITVVSVDLQLNIPGCHNQARLQSFSNQHIMASDLLSQRLMKTEGNEGGVYDARAAGQNRQTAS